MRPSLLLLSLAALLAGAGRAPAQEALPLSLADAVRRAVAEAPAVQLAASREEQSRTVVQQTRAALLPHLDAGASWLNRSYNQASMGLQFPAIPGSAPLAGRIGPFDLWDTRLSASQSLFDPAARAAVRAARLGTEASGAERGTAAEAAAERAALGYEEVVRAHSVLSARAEELALARELVRVAREQVRAGTATPMDVTRAEMQQLTAEGDSLLAASGVGKAEVGLARALGLAASTHFLLPPSSALAAATGPLPDVEAALERGVAERPELALQRAHREGAEAARRAILAERLPRVALFGDVGWNGTATSNLLATRQLGLQLSVPLMDGLRREGRIAEQHAAARQAAIQEGDLRAQVEAEVRTALLDLGSARDQERVAAGRVRLARLEMEQARARFREGAAGNAEVVEAQRTLVVARDAAIAAEHLAATARIRLARATGTAHELR